LGDADFLVLAQDDAGLLLAIAQRDVVDLDVLGELEVLGDFRRVVPFADEPVIGLPGCGICHPFIPLAVPWGCEIGAFLPGRPSRAIRLRRPYSPLATLIFRKTEPKFLIWEPLYKGYRR